LSSNSASKILFLKSASVISNCSFYALLWFCQCVSVKQAFLTPSNKHAYGVIHRSYTLTCACKSIKVRDERERQREREWTQTESTHLLRSVLVRCADSRTRERAWTMPLHGTTLSSWVSGSRAELESYWNSIAVKLSLYTWRNTSPCWQRRRRWKRNITFVLLKDATPARETAYAHVTNARG